MRFEAQRPTRKWCTRPCMKRTLYRRYRARGPVVAACHQCGQMFAHTQPHQLYCCARCRNNAHNQRQKEHFRSYCADRRRIIRHYVIDLLGGHCVGCGEADWRVLQVNHINGGGRAESRSSNIYEKIYKGKRVLDDLDLRCANCNVRYEYDRRRSA